MRWNSGHDTIWPRYNASYYNENLFITQSIMASEMLPPAGKFVATFLIFEHFHRSSPFQMMKQIQLAIQSSRTLVMPKHKAS